MFLGLAQKKNHKERGPGFPTKTTLCPRAQTPTSHFGIILIQPSESGCGRDEKMISPLLVP